MTEAEKVRAIRTIKENLHALLEDENMENSAKEKSPTLLSIRECGQLVPSLSEHTIRKLALRGEIKCMRCGDGKRGKILINFEDLLRYLESCEIADKPVIQSPKTLRVKAQNESICREICEEGKFLFYDGAFHSENGIISQDEMKERIAERVYAKYLYEHQELLGEQINEIYSILLVQTLDYERYGIG